VRAGPKVRRDAFAALDAALAALERHARELSDTAPRTGLDAKFRRFEPGQRVSARIEIAGPGRLVPSVRAGVDVHGDGSVQAYRGRVRRQVIVPGGGESVYAALRRDLEAAQRS